MASLDSIKNNILNVKNNIDIVCNKNKINKDTITIGAAAKYVDYIQVQNLKACGIDIICENRVQDLLEKYDKVSDVKWHFIGVLQTNKIKYIIDKVELIHSVDRVNLADKINEQAKKHNKKADILIQINGGDEESKSGISLQEIDEFYNYIMQKDNLNLVGFMAVMPINAKEELYKNVQATFDKYKEKNTNVKILSMGMSDDYITAIKYGSNFVRLGSCLFKE